MNPELAKIFIIGTPFLKSLYFDSLNHVNNMNKFFQKIQDSKYFYKYNGRDHLILADHFDLSLWGSFFQNTEIKQKFINIFKNTTCTRYEVYNKKILTKNKNIILSLLDGEWQFSKYNIIIPYNPTEKKIINPDYNDWKKRKNLIFYHISNREFAHGATFIRHLPIRLNLNNCSIGYDISKEEWIENFKNSKFGLVIRGDTPGSHAFINSISFGCIPVIISNLFKYIALPFKNIINIKEYSIIINENDFINNPLILIETLFKISKEEIKYKLNKLKDVQKIMLLDHKKSKTCNLILDEFIKIKRF